MPGLTVICDLGGDLLDKKVVEIRQNRIVLEQRKRVAAYARVSTPKDTMLHSLAAQIDYYRQMILGLFCRGFRGPQGQGRSDGLRAEHPA